MTTCAFAVTGSARFGTTCQQPGGYRVVYELDDEPGIESTDYRHYCRRHAERYAEILLASGIVRTARAVELEASHV